VFRPEDGHGGEHVGVLYRLGEMREKDLAREQLGMRAGQESQILEIGTEEIARSPFSSRVLAAVDCGLCLACSVSFYFSLPPATWQMASKLLVRICIKSTCLYLP
jgi:hypothetical protein